MVIRVSKALKEEITNVCSEKNITMTEWVNKDVYVQLIEFKKCRVHPKQDKLMNVCGDKYLDVETMGEKTSITVRPSKEFEFEVAEWINENNISVTTVYTFLFLMCLRKRSSIMSFVIGSTVCRDKWRVGKSVHLEMWTDKYLYDKFKVKCDRYRVSFSEAIQRLLLRLWREWRCKVYEPSKTEKGEGGEYWVPLYSYEKNICNIWYYCEGKEGGLADEARKDYRVLVNLSGNFLFIVNNDSSWFNNSALNYVLVRGLIENWDTLLHVKNRDII